MHAGAAEFWGMAFGVGGSQKRDDRIPYNATVLQAMQDAKGNK